jgi:hypothetical protein
MAECRKHSTALVLVVHIVNCMHFGILVNRHWSVVKIAFIAKILQKKKVCPQIQPSHRNRTTKNQKMAIYRLLGKLRACVSSTTQHQQKQYIKAYTTLVVYYSRLRLSVIFWPRFGLTYYCQEYILIYSSPYIKFLCYHVIKSLPNSPTAHNILFGNDVLKF